MTPSKKTMQSAFLALTALSLLGGCGAKKGLTAKETDQAMALYAANCASCHDQGASGAPTLEALKTRTPAAILASLEIGLMRVQGKALKPVERKLIADFLGASSVKVAGKMCGRTPKLSSAPSWNRWGNGIENRRHQTQGMAPETLELKWAFGFPGAARARSQPAVAGDAIFVGSQDGRVYAIDVESGCVFWTFDADSEVRSAPTFYVDRLYFSDFNANVYALDARSGKPIWKKSVKDHPAGTITGSLTLHDGRLFVPMSSTEIVSAMSGDYGCCTFRGGVAALSARDGKPLWRMHTVAEPKPAGKNRKGVTAYGPSGAPVWSVPTVDAKRGLLYVGTGENYSTPANEMSDAIIAMELATGKIRWVQQTIARDAWNASCESFGNGINCPKEDGPDMDFGAPPVLVTLANGKDMILAGQKSGMVFGLDPDASGRIIWRQRAGTGGFNGGMHWGMASDERTLFVGIADTPGGKGTVGPRRPGLHAFDAATGKTLWSRIEPATCAERKFECETALSAPVTLAGSTVFAGAHNGLLLAYSAADGRRLWRFDTRRAFPTVNGVLAKGGSIDSAGPVIAGNRLVVNSGYDKFGEIPGNVLLVFGPRSAK